MDVPRLLHAHAVAERHGITTNKLASWARRGWITRSVIGSDTFYDPEQVARFIDSRRERPRHPANVTPISTALAEALAGFGIGTATPSRPPSASRRQGAGK